MLEELAPPNGKSTEARIKGSAACQQALYQNDLSLPGYEEVWMMTLFRQAERALPIVTRYICLLLAAVNYIRTGDLLTTIVLIGLAKDTLSVQEAIKMLLRYMRLWRLDHTQKRASSSDAEEPSENVRDQSDGDRKE